MVPQEAVLQVALKENYKENLDALKERFRQKMKAAMPDVRLSFEPIELTDKILSQGSPTPIEVRVAGKDKKLNEEYANKVIDKLKQISYLRDIQLAQPVKYPAIDIDIDRTRAAQMGVDGIGYIPLIDRFYFFITLYREKRMDRSEKQPEL